MRPFYRDALVNAGTKFMLDCKNTSCWDTPGVVPVAGKELGDLWSLIPDADGMVFAGTGFGSNNGGDGIVFSHGTSGVLEIGSADTLQHNLGKLAGLKSFYVVMWAGLLPGYDTADFAGMGGLVNSSRADSQWMIDAGEGGDSCSFSIGRGASAVTVGSNDHDLEAEVVTQFGFSFEIIAGKTVVKKYRDGVPVSQVVIDSEIVIRDEDTALLTFGAAGGGDNKGFHLMRAFLEVTEHENVLVADSGAGIADRILLDYEVNRGRFGILAV